MSEHGTIGHTGTVGAPQAATRRRGPSAWTRPVVAALAVAAAVTYGWGASGGALEIYYEAAVRSMGANWHDFLYGAVDPAGTVTLDKLPGAFWVQALSVRLFGFHEWAIILPQIVEGVLTVLVLYHAVSRLAGEFAGVVAAAVVVITPATVALNRGNISDSLLILMLVLATNSLVSALVTGRVRWLLVSGVFVGIGFQAKMLEAWLVVPALGLAWLLAGPRGVARRVTDVASMCVVAVAVSLSWMVSVSLIPRGQRPYVDGSTHDSLFQQVFVYNGFHKVGAGSSQIGPGTRAFAALVDFRLPGAGVSRLLTGAAGRDVAWLIPVGVLSALVVLVDRRKAPRTDHLRVTAVLWGTWLLVDAIAFTVLGGINAYYLAALSPAVGALCGIGAEWIRARGVHDRRVVRSLLAVAALTAAYGFWLSRSPAVRAAGGWLVAMLFVAGALLLLAPWQEDRDAPDPAQRWAARTVTGAALVSAAMGFFALTATADVVAAGLGPFDTPYQSNAITRVTQVEPRETLAAIRPGLALLLQLNRSDRYLAATYTSIIAAPLIIDNGKEIEPIGGFDGSLPSPSLSDLVHQVRSGELQTVISTPSSDPRVTWVRKHCLTIPPASGAGSQGNPVSRIVVYYCAGGS